MNFWDRNPCIQELQMDNYNAKNVKSLKLTMFTCLYVVTILSEVKENKIK